jgi:membrane-bound lytic murein transglycosylase B
METKLRELFGIYYKSDLTKAVQEKLWCLGYDVLIDGRLGSGTRNQVKAFQKAWGLPQTGAVTEALSAKLSEVLAQDRQRDLKDYRPPAAAKPSRTATHQQFTNPQALVKIKGYYLEDKNLFGGMERAFQVPGPLVASIMWIETGYGGYFGKNKAAVVLASMAASAEYRLIAPAVSDLEGDAEARAFLAETADKRGAWARDELAALLKYAWSNGLDPMTFPGSIYGAIGYGQFMPSNVAKYAVDGDGDGRIDLFNKADAIFSIGRYLRENGWQGNMGDEEKRRAVIMRYNRSGVYVNTVLYVADYIGY